MGWSGFPSPLAGEALRLSLRRDPRSGEGEGSAATGEFLRQTPHLPIATQWVPSSPARGEEILSLASNNCPCRKLAACVSRSIRILYVRFVPFCLGGVTIRGIVGCRAGNSRQWYDLRGRVARSNGATPFCCMSETVSPVFSLLLTGVPLVSRECP